jgi:hypothetical protein
MCQIEAAFAGGEGLASTPIDERGHVQILSWVRGMVSMGGFVHVRNHNMGSRNSSFKRIEFMDNIRDIERSRCARRSEELTAAGLQNAKSGHGEMTRNQVRSTSLPLRT